MRQALTDVEHSTHPHPDCRQRAYLSLRRHVASGGPPGTEDDDTAAAFEPDDVTRLVGLRPTRAWRRGDRIPGRPGRRRSSAWDYELPEVRTFLSEDVVVPLLDAIEPHASGLSAAREAMGLRAAVSVVIRMSGVRDAEDGGIVLSTAAITYTGETVRRLARLQLSIEHDQYVFLPD